MARLLIVEERCGGSVRSVRQVDFPDIDITQLPIG